MMVYGRCMSRTNVNIEDEACAEGMYRYRSAPYVLAKHPFKFD